MKIIRHVKHTIKKQLFMIEIRDKSDASYVDLSKVFIMKIYKMRQLLYFFSMLIGSSFRRGSGKPRASPGH